MNVGKRKSGLSGRTFSRYVDILSLFTASENRALLRVGFLTVDGVGNDWRLSAIEEVVTIAGLEVSRADSTV